MSLDWGGLAGAGSHCLYRREARAGFANSRGNFALGTGWEWLAASGARCAIRDSRAPGAERYLWMLTVFGYYQVAAGRTGELGNARSQAEAALAALRGGLVPDAA